MPTIQSASGTLALPSSEAHSASSAARPGILGRLRAIFGGDAFSNGAVVLAITVGFFHGWLKLRYRHPVTTFAFDIFLLIAMVAVFARARSFRGFFPQGASTRALLVFYGLCLAYLPLALLPGMPPFLVALSTLRGWVFATFLFGVGYQIVRSRAQVHGYFLLIVLLGVVTAIYGVFQNDEEVMRMMEEDEYMRSARAGSGYVDDEGGFHFRRFSTFVSAGTFGGTMGSTMLFAMALFLGPTTRAGERTFLAIAMLPMAYGLMLSGSRSAAISLGVGFLILGMRRRQAFSTLALAGVVGVGVLLAIQQTRGGIIDRLADLNLGTIFGRFWWPTYTGLTFMADHPLGGGLGKTGFRPRFLQNWGGYSDYYTADGDLGRVMIEFGVLGLVVLIRVAFVVGRRMFQLSRNSAATPSNSLVLAASVNFWMCILGLATGSPFAGIPLGVLVWFFAGASERLVELDQAQEAAAQAESKGPAAGLTRSKTGRTTASSGKRFLFASPGSGPGPTTRPASRDEAGPTAVSPGPARGTAGDRRPGGNRPRKAFLYADPGSLGDGDRLRGRGRGRR